MTVRLRFFASLRERLKTSEAERSLRAGATVGELWAALCRERPDLEPLSASMSFAVNREYVGREHVLVDGDEVALIPPVSGGCAGVDRVPFSVVGSSG
jgi:molybdopterin converting factor subunit 1